MTFFAAQRLSTVTPRDGSMALRAKT